MTKDWGNDGETRPLSSLGISEPEERAYRRLLAHPGATSQEIASALGMPPRKTQRLLDAIEAKGLATHSPERPRRYIPAAPDIAMEAMILQRQEDLQRARAVVQELQEQAKAGQSEDGPEQIVELITSREAERQIFEHMNLAAQHQVVSLVRPPVRISRLDVPRQQDQRTQRQAQARGVRFRTVVDAEFLEVPGTADAVRADIKAGEEVRVVSQLPFKMILADNRVAIVPLNLQQADSPVLLVRSSALLDALYVLFEMFWERGAAISFARSALETSAPQPQLPDDAQELVRLMAAGLNDKVIARELGVSVRTLERRVADLMRSFDAQTRFQAGWLTASRLVAAGS